jgi:large subunit ribosomal protein L24
MKIRKDDTVVITTGTDSGKRGRVRHAWPDEERVIVEGATMIKRHSRAQRTARQAGIIELEAPIHVSNVMLICSKCGKPTRVGFQFLADGKRIRVCKSCQEVID